MTSRHLLASILLAYLILALLYSVTVPIFEASDELWHYPMVQHIATTSQLPVQDPGTPTLWRQEGSQPPLYYMAAALLTAGIDSSDLGYVRRLNPHADIGLVLPDGNANMIVHRSTEAFPWQGSVLAVHIARFFSITLGLGTVWVSYALAHEVFTDQPVIWLGAAALTAFLPMFLFISASVNNDNLSNLTGNLLLLLLVRLVKRESLPRPRDCALIGIVAGAGMLSKLSLGFMIPLVVLTLLVLSLRLRDWRPLVIGGLISGTLTILIAGWWYLRNQQLYGDPTGLNVFLDLVGRRAVPASLAQLWTERNSITQAYWGFFGGMNVPMPAALYQIFNLIGGIGLLAALAWILYRLLRRSGITWPMILTLVWPLLTFVSFLRWTAETPASQGRLLFPALAAISLWMAAGLVLWLPQRWRPLLMSAATGYFALVALVVPFAVIQPAYTPNLTSAPETNADLTFTEREGSGTLTLVYAQVETGTVQPEHYILLDTAWTISQAMSRDWSLFIHLLTPDDVIIGQRDVYPAQGLLAASDLSAGQQWQQQIAVWVPPTAYAPMTLRVELGWYDLATRARLHLDDGSDSTILGSVNVQPRPSDLDLPNPMSVNFGGQIELLGYSVSDLSPAAGSSFDVRLFWRRLEPITNDYKVFVNVLDPLSLSKYAASDAMPVQWTRPTSSWQEGEIIEDTHTLTVDPNAPPETYEIQLGLYQETPEGFPRLKIITAEGGEPADVLTLTRLRIAPAGEGS